MIAKKSKDNRKNIPKNFQEFGLTHLGSDGKKITLLISRENGIYEIKLNGNTYSNKDLGKIAKESNNIIDPGSLKNELREALSEEEEVLTIDMPKEDQFVILGENQTGETPHPLDANSKFLQNWGVRRDLDLFKLGIEGVRKEYALDYYRKNSFLDSIRKESIQKFLYDVYQVLCHKKEKKSELDIFRCVFGCELLGLEKELISFAKTTDFKNFKSEFADYIKNILLKYE